MQRFRMPARVLLVILIVGAFLRVYHASWKVFSYDETITALRASGHSWAEFESFVHDGRRHTLGELARFQRSDPARTPADVWASLAADDPQHPPLYFLLTRWITRVAGGSVLALRLPALVFGILGTLAAWWLGRELFANRWMALCFAGLVAVSPFHVAYAQQAREYSLWMLLTCASGALLLHAVRSGRAGWVVAYGGAAAIGLWTFPLSALVLIAHAVYVALPASGARKGARIGVWAALAAAAASFVPWLLVMAHGWRVTVADTTWNAMALSPLLYAGKWIFNLAAVFFDLDYLSVALFPVAAVLLAAAAWCCWTFVRRAPARTSSFVLLLGGIPAAYFLGSDVLQHQAYAVQSRYLTPLWLAVELATAWGLVTLARAPAWRVAGASLFAAGIVSCLVSAQAHSWWIANNDKTIPAIAAALAKRENPTIVYVDDGDHLLELAASADPKLAFDLRGPGESNRPPFGGERFALARPNDTGNLSFRQRLHAITLPALFPSGVDPAIAMLRHRAAADRGTATSGDLALYAVGGSRAMTALRPPVR